MNFFWTEDEYLNWVKLNVMEDNEDIYCLNIQEALNVAFKIFRL